MDKKFFVGISRIDEDQRMVYGYGTRGDIKDSYDTIIDLDSVKKCLPDYAKWANVREMHQLSAVGTADEIRADDQGVYLGVKVVDDSAWKKVKNGVYKGFSIGGKQDYQDGDRIFLKSITEFSLVDRPANEGCPIDEYRIQGGNMKPENKKPDDPARVDKRDDVDPKEGKDKYGNVKFADQKNKKYPIDTAAHIKAAWNYISKPKNAGKYSAEDLKAIKDKIIAAWKDKIDKEGPPSAVKKADEGDVERGTMEMTPQGYMQYVLDETDDCMNALYALQSIIGLKEREESEGETDPEGQKQIESLTAAIAALKDFIQSEIMENDEDDVAAAAEPDLERKGAVLSKGNLDRAQAIHDHSVSMGAKCPDAAECQKADKGDVEHAAGVDIIRIAEALQVEAKDEPELIRVLTEQREKDLARIKELEDEPATPPNQTLRAVTVKKEDDNPAGKKEVVRLEDMDEFKALPPEQQALALIRAAQASPQVIRGAFAGPTKKQEDK